MGMTIELVDKQEVMQTYKDYQPRLATNVSAFGESLLALPTVDAIPKADIQKAIDKVEEYICDIETDTVKAQGMAQALDIIEQILKEKEDATN